MFLNLAISLDGFIADEDGGFDWIKGDGDKSHDTKHTFDFLKLEYSSKNERLWLYFQTQELEQKG